MFKHFFSTKSSKQTDLPKGVVLIGLLGSSGEQFEEEVVGTVLDVGLCHQRGHGRLVVAEIFLQVYKITWRENEGRSFLVRLDDFYGKLDRLGPRSRLVVDDATVRRRSQQTEVVTRGLL